MTDSTNRLSEIEARLDAATPGPWRRGWPDIKWNNIERRNRFTGAWRDTLDVCPDVAYDAETPIEDLHETVVESGHDDAEGILLVADADLIAHAPADLRYLLDRVRELEAKAKAAYEVGYGEGESNVMADFMTKIDLETDHHCAACAMLAADGTPAPEA